jgi:hypothetical protein
VRYTVGKRKMGVFIGILRAPVPLSNGLYSFDIDTYMLYKMLAYAFT